MSPVDSPEPTAAVRLAAALDRIAAALVRRAEDEAAARDHADRAREAAQGTPALDNEAVGELVRRVDGAIGRIRAALGEP